MSIHIRDMRSDDIVALAPQLSGRYIQTGSTDHNGRLVTGHIQEAKLMPTAPASLSSSPGT
ncbi:hypothetical protein PUN71_022810 [Arthrobacter sp. NQ7]|uniref:hypothetical protein n=1 Tax=Arthrobacter sp. NQ7 TaxID=3032303 RepID=UPI00240ED683|nr:hypothetical protein [Arthrobacter sp. NQ7]MDJ0460045.1 hypothetical protein [Arthrobacter sp. NQ7]